MRIFDRLGLTSGKTDFRLCSRGTRINVSDPIPDFWLNKNQTRFTLSTI